MHWAAAECHRQLSFYFFHLIFVSLITSFQWRLKFCCTIPKVCSCGYMSLRLRLRSRWLSTTTTTTIVMVSFLVIWRTRRTSLSMMSLNAFHFLFLHVVAFISWPTHFEFGSLMSLSCSCLCYRHTQLTHISYILFVFFFGRCKNHAIEQTHARFSSSHGIFSQIICLPFSWR